MNPNNPNQPDSSMNPGKPKLRIDFLAAKYLAAIEADDFLTQEALWHLARTEADLEAALLQVHDDLLEEYEAEMVDTIAATAQTTMKSAELARPVGEPVTLAEVATEMIRVGIPALMAEDLALNEQVKRSTIPLPRDRGRRAVLKWAAEHFGEAAAQRLDYWKAFRDTAGRLEEQMTTDLQLAARRAKPQDQRKDQPKEGDS